MYEDYGSLKFYSVLAIIFLLFLLTAVIYALGKMIVGGLIVTPLVSVMVAIGVVSLLVPLVLIKLLLAKRPGR